MKIIYKNNDATQVPVYMFGTCIQIKQWLRGEQFVPFLKEVFAFNKTEEEYDDGQGNRYDFVEDPETGEYQ